MHIICSSIRMTQSYIHYSPEENSCGGLLHAGGGVWSCSGGNALSLFLAGSSSGVSANGDS